MGGNPLNLQEKFVTNISKIFESEYRLSETDIIRITLDYQVGIDTESRYTLNEVQTWWDVV